MAKKLFVGSLSWNTTDDTLRNFFSQAGNVVSARVIMDRNTGRSRGFGFVEFDTEEESTRAMHELNEKELDGRAIKISEAQEREDRGGNGGGYRGGRDNNRRGGYDRGNSY